MTRSLWKPMHSALMQTNSTICCDVVALAGILHLPHPGGVSVMPPSPTITRRPAA